MGWGPSQVVRGRSEDNKESGRWMDIGGASWGQGEWERRGGKDQAVTMGVTSIKEKGIYYRLWFARRLFIPGKGKGVGVGGPTETQ